MKRFAIFMILSITACSPGESTTISSSNGYWLYQLQDCDMSDSTIPSFSYLVTDYSRDGSESGRYTYQEVSNLRAKGVTVLSYISIGEAESYRYYWNTSWETSPPSWLGNENPEWNENYKIKYWDTDWQNIIFGYLDRIIASGFNGVYLDIIDAYEYWSDSENGEGTVLTESTAAQYMMDFVLNIAEYCRTNGVSNFLVFPQNGDSILQYDDGTYLSGVSGIGVEDVFYMGTNPIPDSDVNTRLTYLRQFTAADKPVLSVDYIDNGWGYTGNNAERMREYITACNTNGFIPYIARTDRDLNEINTVDEIQP